jgi:hypothetical protein
MGSGSGTEGGVNFKPELVEKILAGEKTQTRRLMSDNPNSPWYRDGCRLKINHAYALCPGRGKDQVGKIVVLHTAEKLLGAIRHHEAVMEGFGSVAEFQAYWERMHGSFDPNEPVWQITFALIHPDDYGLWEGGT